MSLAEYRGRLAWLEAKEDERSKEEYYLARISLEIRRVYNVLVRDTSSLKIEEFLLEFHKGKEGEVKKKFDNTCEGYLEHSWAIWSGLAKIFGGKINDRTVDGQISR